MTLPLPFLQGYILRPLFFGHRNDDTRQSLESKRHSSRTPRDFFVYAAPERTAFSCDLYYPSSNPTAVLVGPKDWLWSHSRHSLASTVVPQRLDGRMELSCDTCYCSYILCKVGHFHSHLIDHF
jgi:hypothetical protein